MKKQKLIFVFLLLSLIFSSCKDSSTEPDNQFVQISFKYGFKNELNTFENTYQKDLFYGDVVKVNFWLTIEEQKSIIKKAEESNFFMLPDTLITIQEDSIEVSLSPNPGAQTLRIRCNSKDKTTVWFYPLVEDRDQMKQIMELNSFIISLIESKPEYKKLPPSRGGYD